MQLKLKEQQKATVMQLNFYFWKATYLISDDVLIFSLIF